VFLINLFDLKLLYICYWGVDDALTKATVFPSLKIIEPYFSTVYLATIERQSGNTVEAPRGVIHVPFRSLTFLPRLLEKVMDVFIFSCKLLWLVKTKKTDLVICRGSMAATFGVFLSKVAGQPFFVESFEPHADYMLEGSTWKRNSIEYKFQTWVEAQSLKGAQYLMPVTHNYAKYLIEKGVLAEKLQVMPCCVDMRKFSYNKIFRQQVRGELGISNRTVVGIYVGKFGDIYLNEESFVLFKRALDFFVDGFFLIILTPQNVHEVSNQLSRVGYPKEYYLVANVPHTKVPEYLSAADFAFSLIRTSPSRKYCSPIKNGEYWANGLPILLTKGVGDDEDIILQNKAGVILDVEQENNSEVALAEIKDIIRQDREILAKKISLLADRHRNFKIIADGYSRIFKKRMN